MISEAKLDFSSPAEFHMEGYATPFRLDENTSGAEILSYMKKDIPSALLISDLSSEGFFVEIRLRKKEMVSLLLLWS